MHTGSVQWFSASSSTVIIRNLVLFLTVILYFYLFMLSQQTDLCLWRLVYVSMDQRGWMMQWSHQAPSARRLRPGRRHHGQQQRQDTFMQHCIDAQHTLCQQSKI
uniref:Uncharacterized protein n=1 Tax=Aegilops tauschii subsp. strangulata TaxID=200361 RepID=A0A453HX72_AEGTS